MANGRKVAAIACVLLATTVGAAVADDAVRHRPLEPATAMPATVEQVRARVLAEGRGADQMANLAWQQLALPDTLAYLAGTDTRSVLQDPFREGWAPARGQHRVVSYRNRYGARIVADLYAPNVPFRDPVTGSTSSGPFPGLVLSPGSGSRGDDYEGVAQSLAEAGYVVVAFDAQGQGRSDVQPGPGMCDPDGAWRAPQESGLREQGPCAGVWPDTQVGGPVTMAASALLSTLPGGDAVVGQIGLPLYLAERRLFPEDTQADSDRIYLELGVNHALGALDAADWLRSSANPLRSMVDGDRVGVLGHSLGAWGAVTAANGDPQHRFRAAAGFDADTPPYAMPTVPTLFIAAERADSDAPWVPTPDPDRDHPWVRSGEVWRDSGVDAMEVTLRSSTHGEWYYTPYALLNPVAGPLQNSSSKGERVSVYYLQAWFDLELKGLAPEPGVASRADWQQQRQDALRRLTADRFDGSADGSSIGQGTYDPATGRNRPYLLAGEPTAEHLSHLFRSSYDMAGRRCEDMRTAC